MALDEEVLMDVVVDVATLLPGDVVEGSSEPTPLKHLEITPCRFQFYLFCFYLSACSFSTL